jgi:hypothetical protein
MLDVHAVETAAGETLHALGARTWAAASRMLKHRLSRSCGRMGPHRMVDHDNQPANGLPHYRRGWVCRGNEMNHW